MSAPTITRDQLMMAVLSLDVYHRGYNNPGLPVGEGVYDFVAKRNAEQPGLTGTWVAKDIGFFAQEYTSLAQDRTVIAYRGTDDGFAVGAKSDWVNGFGIGAGRPDGPQAQAGIAFYEAISGADVATVALAATGFARPPSVAGGQG